MVFVTAIGFFIVPALLGGRRETMIAQIIIEQVLQTLNWGFAGAISVLLLVVVTAVFFAVRPTARAVDDGGRPARRDGNARRRGVLHAATHAADCAGCGHRPCSDVVPRRVRNAAPELRGALESCSSRVCCFSACRLS